MTIDMKPPKHPSSHISKMGHDPETGEMVIEFSKGGVYHYDGVDAGTFDDMHQSISSGSFFHQYVKPRFKPRQR